MSFQLSDPPLWLVAERVGQFLDRKGLSSERADELFAAGEECLFDVLRGKPHASIRYLRRCIKNAVRRANQTDRLLAVPPSTRYGRIKRGKPPGDWECHSWDTVFDGDAVLTTAEPHWRHVQRQRSVKSTASVWLEIVDLYDKLFSLCRDDIDRAIVEARSEGLSPDILESGYLPPHVDDVARMVGMSSRQVQRRLNDLEARYYRWAECKLPTRRQQQRAPR